MNELISVLEDIKVLLYDMNNKLELIDDNISGLKKEVRSVKGYGLYDSISDVCDKLESIKGTGLYNSIVDICDKLDTIDTSISLIDI